MLVTIEIDPARRTAAFREVSYLAAGDSCRVVLDGVRGADFGTLGLALYRDAASESPVASCSAFSPVAGHPALADGLLALDTFEMSAWFAAAAPAPEESDSDSDSVAPAASVSREPRLAARASLAERSVRAEGWLVASDSDRVWAACRVPVLLRPGAGTSGASDPSSVRALVSELVAGLVSAALADKADKVPSAPAGNLASLDASGNLADSGATPASIKAAAVAEVVANAPAALDTLKEIADILGSPQQSGTVLKRISDLESGKADSSSLAAVATSGSYNDLSGRPAIPAAVAVDAALATRGAAADAEVVGNALRGKRDVLDLGVRGAEDGANSWFVVNGSKLTADNGSWSGGAYRIEPSLDAPGGYELYVDNGETYDLVGTFELDENYSAVVQTYHIECCVDILATVSQIPTVPSAYTSTPAMDGVGSAGSSTAWAKGDHVHPTDTSRAAASDLPYALVTPGEWEFSDGRQYDVYVEGNGDSWYLMVSFDGISTISFDSPYSTEDEANSVLSFSFNAGSLGLDDEDVTATRTSLPGHLSDRSVNAVSDEPALVLPPLDNQGKSRDLLVRLTLTSSTSMTVSATSPETVTWDSAGSPSGTYEAGTYLFRFTEVSQSVFHFDDLGSGGSIDPSVLAAKLDSTSAAPAFDATKTYSVGEHVTYEGVLYECSTVVTTAGSWTGSTNWTATDMTSPDATLDLMADGRLRLVSADGEVLWMQGYNLAPASSATLSCDKVNFYAFASGTTSAAFSMPAAPAGKTGDFVLDVDNTANASASVTATLTGAGTAFDVFTPEGVNLSTDILTFAGGEQCELYFTMTAFGTAAKPAWKVVKQVVEKQEFGS